MLSDYVFLYNIISNLIANIIQRNLYLIDAKLLNHVYNVFVFSDHLILRVRIASFAIAISTFISIDVLLFSGCLFLWYTFIISFSNGHLMDLAFETF